jgi:hypothetical protein cdivTM_05680
MKKKLTILLGILTISIFSFAKTEPTIENNLNQLDQQLIRLQQMEEQKLAQEEAKANAAQLQLQKYQEMQSTISQRLETINSKSNNSIFGKEMKEKARDYQKLSVQLNKEMEKLQQIIKNYEMLKSLK